MAALSLITASQDLPDRAKLASAQEAARKANDAVARQRLAIDRARISVRTAENLLKVAEEAVGKAREAHAQALADAATTDTVPPTSPVQAARRAVIDAQDGVEAAKGAFTQLKEDLPGCQQVAREAEIAVETAISEVLVPHVRSLLDRATEIALELMPFKQTLFSVFAGGSTPEGFVLQGDAPLAAVRAEAGRLLGTISTNDRRLADPLAVCRARLRVDPYSPVDLTPSPPDAAA